MKNIIILITVILACILLVSCGQRGSLYPNTPTPPVKPTTDQRSTPSTHPAYVDQNKPVLPPQKQETTETKHFPDAAPGNQEPGGDITQTTDHIQQDLAAD